MTELKGDALCNEWLRLVALLYGQKRADKSKAIYGRREGWYYVALASVSSDDSMGVIGKVYGKRRKAVLEMVETLRGRAQRCGGTLDWAGRTTQCNLVAGHGGPCTFGPEGDDRWKA